MHDPMVLIFAIKRPWPQRSTIGRKRRLYWPPMLDVWHVEPQGRDSGTVCKGMGGSDLSWHNVRWAWTHRRHLSLRFWPYLSVKRWLVDRCAECGRRFFWKDDRHGYMSSDAVYHDRCMTLRHVRSQLDDAAKALTFTATDTERWRVERWLNWREEQAASPTSAGATDA